MAIPGLSSGTLSFAANDRYVAVLVTISDTRSLLTQIDEQTNTQMTLTPPACAPGTGVSSHTGLPYQIYPRFTGGLDFGGPWLLAGCDLYNLNSSQWIPFQLSPQCSGNCEAVDIGRYWMKIVSDGGDSRAYPQYRFNLQNLASGQFMPDPVSPGWQGS